MFPQLRVLPILILLCCLMLAQRMEYIWVVGQAIASEAAAEEKPPEAKPAETKSAETKPDEVKSDAKPEVGNAESAKTESPPATETPAAKAESADPLLFNDSELDILQSLAARRTQLEERERAIDQKEGLLQITEQRIDQKLEELKKLRGEMETAKGEIEKLSKLVEGKQNEKVAGLVKAYESMKAKDAARIFDQLPMPVLMDIITQMKEAKMAPVLAAMDPNKAKSVTTEMAQKRTLADLQDAAKANNPLPLPAAGLPPTGLPPGPPPETTPKP